MKKFAATQHAKRFGLVLFLISFTVLNSGAQFAPVLLPSLPTPSPWFTEMNPEAIVVDNKVEEERPLWADDFENMVRSYRAIAASA